MEHREGGFSGYKDFNIYYQAWLPDGDRRAVLLVSHGYAEHSGRYHNLVNYYVPRGYAVYALDHRGHGRSDGERVQVERFTDYFKDLKTFFDLVHEENPDDKIFLVGHSMGAAISQGYVLRWQHELAGLVLSGGGIDTDDMPPRQQGDPNAPLDASGLSRDPVVIEAYENDPLVYRGPRPSRPAMNQGRDKMRELVKQITMPILIMAGAAAPMGDGPRSRALYENVGSKDKTLKLYEGLLHEIFNEPEHKQVMADMEEWLEAHL